MQVCHSDIEHSALLSSVQNHTLSETKLAERNTLVNSSKSDLWALKSRDKLIQSFDRINKILMNLNIMSCTV